MDCVMGSFVYRIIRHENFQSATSDLYLSFYQTFIFHMTVLYFFSVFRIPSFCGGYRTTFRRRAGTTQWKNADENAVIQTVFQDLQNPSREGRFFLIDARRFIGCIPEDHLQRNIDLSDIRVFPAVCSVVSQHSLIKSVLLYKPFQFINKY